MDRPKHAVRRTMKKEIVGNHSYHVSTQSWIGRKGIKKGEDTPQSSSSKRCSQWLKIVLVVLLLKVRFTAVFL